MIFQVLDFKGKYFLNLLNNELLSIEPSYIKEGLQIKHFRCLNMLYIRASRAITCHTPIGEYHLYFFPREDFICICGDYPIETRHHILHNCKRFNNYWDLRRDTISYFVAFLESNLNIFSKKEGVT